MKKGLCEPMLAWIDGRWRQIQEEDRNWERIILRMSNCTEKTFMYMKTVGVKK